MAFQKATKKKSRLRLALLGPSGSGKTYSALAIGKHLGKRIAVIDTERGSASKYADDVAEFDVLELTSFSPTKYIAAMREAASAGYDVLVVDSLSHAWFGADGILDQKDKKGGNSFDAWRTLTPQHNDLVEAILAYPGHVICTMRSKMEYVQEKDSKGKTVVRKVGMAPVQREGMEYEFDVIGEMDVDHALHITKSRAPTLADAIIRKPSKDVAEALLGWLDQGAVDEPRPTDAPPTKPAAGAVEPPSKETGTSAGNGKPGSPTPSTTTEPPALDMEPAYKLAALIVEATDKGELQYALDHVTTVVDDSKQGKAVRLALDALLEERTAHLDGTDWQPTDAKKAAAGRMKQRLAERAPAAQ